MSYLDNDDNLPGSDSTNGDSAVMRQAGGAFSWVRVLRGLGCALCMFWLFMLYATINQALFRVPLDDKWANTVIGALAVIVMFLCLRGRLRYAFSLLFMLFVAFGLWAYWGVPSP